MSQQFEAFFRGYKNAELFYHIWRCDNPKGTILLTHGLAEHSECYKDLANDLSKQDYDLIAYDLRGHGRSEGSRGVVDDFDDFVKDLLKLSDYCVEKYKDDKPFFLLGHSLGGLITMKSLLSHSFLGVDGVILSSPCFGLKLELPAWKKNMSKFGSKWLPKLTLWNELRYEELVRDVEKAKSYEADPLRHEKISPRLFLGMLESMEFIKENEKEFQLPLLTQLAGQDHICNSADGVRFYENCGSKHKKIHIYDESYHEVYNDLDRDEVIRDLVNFLNKFEKLNKEKPL